MPDFTRPDRSPDDGSSLVQGLRVIRERWWMIAIPMVVCALASLALSLSSTKQYSSTSTLLIGSAGTDLTSLIDPNASAGVRDPARDQATALLLATSDAVATRVKSALKLPDDPSALLGEITAASEPDANIISVTATDPDPVRASKLANAFADQFVAYRTAAQRARVRTGEQLITQRLNALPANETGQRAELQQALQRVIGLEAVTTGDAEVVDRSTPSGEPSSPRTKRNLILAVVLGLVAGLALVFLIDLFDRRIKTVEDFEAVYGFRALASVAERTRVPNTQRERSLALEPFRILRNSLTFLGKDGADARVVLVTSAMPAEGKSTVAAGLARAIALAGQSVVLVEVDLRRPTFHQQFNLGDDLRGLTTALIGGVPVQALLRPALPGLRTLTVLPSGPVPPNSAELLRSPAMHDLLKELASTADMVVLDAPPLLPVADTQVLLDNPQIDACLIVARANETTRDQARRSRAVLERHRIQNFGLVVNGMRESDGDYDYYGAATADEPSKPGQPGPQLQA